MQHQVTTGPGQDALLLPWHATGRLPASRSRRIAAAIDRDEALCGAFASIRREQAAVIDLHARLGAPSPRVLLALFAAIETDAAAAKISPGRF